VGLRQARRTHPSSRPDGPPRSFAAALLDAPPTSGGRILRLRLLPGSVLVIVAGTGLSWVTEGSSIDRFWFAPVAFAVLMASGIALLVSQAARLLDRAEGRRRTLEAHYQQLVEQLPLVVYVDELTDSSSNIYTSPQVEPLLGYTVEEWVSDPELFVKVLHPEDRARVLEEVRRTNSEGAPFSTEYRVIAKDGRTVWIRDEATLYRERGEALHSQGYMLDITRRRQAEEELRLLASSDALTSLPNRSLLTERLAGDHAAPRSLLFLDLDDFKTINDSLGHRAGDRVLVELAHRIGRAVRDGDLVARIGGDEFGVLAASEDEATLQALAERLLDAVRAPLVLEGRELRLSTSIGIATGGAAEDLLRNADLAMYAAKRRGGDGFAFFAPEMHAAAELRLALLAELARADLLEELVLHYQPTFDLRDGGIEGVESLLRWQHPRHGLLAPGRFIAAAEESGAIVEIGRWVLREACREAARWGDVRGRVPVVAVNVSGRQLRESGFVGEVSGALAAAGLPASALRLELTESVLISATEEARANLAAAAELGVELSIDDFGAGHSWIGNLQQLTPDVLKIDRSFMVDPSGGDSPLLRALVALGRELGLKVVAEGIETEQQLTAVRRLRCDAAQGFHLARPMPAAELRDLLAREHRLPGLALRLA
jgi:diguanylate cyclase (GGDEF)-like protein/PAS domain S-box-containing protein